MNLTSQTITCDNLDAAISDYTERFSYRLDMLMTADSPRIALLSKNGDTIKLIARSLEGLQGKEQLSKCETSNGWVTGRAGMMYRDLIPGRADGRIAASHIRLGGDGPVPDYVHYHKIEFQMIFCLRGQIRVVYEDQGPPFWLGAGDCVLQPPEIRHRVLESFERAEVVEISMPAIHETWVEHEIALPTANIRPDRKFGGQRFCRYRAGDAEWNSDGTGIEFSDMAIGKAAGERYRARRVRSNGEGCIELSGADAEIPEFYFCFVTSGELRFISRDSRENKKIGLNESLFFTDGVDGSISLSPDAQFLEVSIHA